MHYNPLRILTIATLIAVFIPSIAAAEQEVVNLPVPYTPETPNGVWTKPWNNACEEASIIMTEQYYLGDKERTIPATEAKNLMWPLFGWEDKQFGSNADTDATRTAKIINDYSSFNATVQYNPTLADIQNELDAGHPVISLHYGYDLKNPHHRFRRGGSSYHMMVIVGYDHNTHEFIVNDSGTDRYSGLDYRYFSDIIMSTLHDFSYKTHQANGEPVVLFTSPKQLVKAVGKNAIYLIEGNQRHYITGPSVFKNHRWSWKIVKTVDPTWLSNLERGSAISK